MSSVFFASRNTLAALAVLLVGLTSSACGLQNSDLSDARISFAIDAANVAPIDAAIVVPVDAVTIAVDARVANPDAAAVAIDAHVVPPDAASTPSIDAAVIAPHIDAAVIAPHIDAAVGSPDAAAVASIDAAPSSADANSGPFAGGGGTADDPYLIATIDQLLAVNDQNYQASSFRLIADLDLTGVTMEPIGMQDDSDVFTFAGTFDGNHHRISNWTYSSQNDCVGLFSSLSGTVSDVVVNLPTLSGGPSTTVGGITGCDYGGRIIRDQVIGGDLSSGMYVAGIAGTQDDQGQVAGIANCFSSATVSGQYVGGLVVEGSGQIIDSYATGAVLSTSYGGGLMAFQDDPGLIVRSYASGAVSAVTQAGGLVASTGTDSVNQDSFWDIDSTGQAASDVGQGLTDDQMTDASNFTNWDFIHTWTIADGGEPTLQPLGNVAPMTAPSQNIDVGASGPAPYAFTLNAFDFNGDDLTYQILSPPSVGVLTAISDTQFTYTPAGWSAFQASLTFQVTDSHGATSPISTITIVGEAACNPAEPRFAHGGNGSSATPYVLTTAAELQVVDEYAVCNFILGNDIDLDGITMAPLCASNGYSGFNATFDGNDHEIKNYSFASTDASTRVGLFAITGSSSTIQNLGVTNVDVSGVADVGAITGYLGGNLINCYSTGLVTGTPDSGSIGGLAGESEAYGQVRSCYSEATVTNGDAAGGLIGTAWFLSFSDSHFSGDVSGDWSVGGLVGWHLESNIDRCFTTGTVSNPDGNANVGGLIGLTTNDEWHVRDSWSSSDINAVHGGEVGGLIGFGPTEPYEMSRVYVVGKVTGPPSHSGGLVGILENGGTHYATDAYWDTDTTTQSSTANGDGTPESDDAMLQQSTYVGFDFTNVWIMPTSGYPQLR